MDRILIVYSVLTLDAFYVLDYEYVHVLGMLRVKYVEEEGGQSVVKHEGSFGQNFEDFGALALEGCVVFAITFGETHFGECFKVGKHQVVIVA